MINPSINSAEIDFWIELTQLEMSEFHRMEIIEMYGEPKDKEIDNLIKNGFLSENNEIIQLPRRSELIKKLLNVLPYSENYLGKQSKYDFDRVKVYLASVQKQLTYFETEGKKSFLTLRTMVEKIVMQAKNYINKVFEISVNDFKDSTTWISIPHVSPIGIYEPIEEVRKKFSTVMKELDISISNLIEEHLTNLSLLVDPLHKKLGYVASQNLNHNAHDNSKSLVKVFKTHIDDSKEKISDDISKFSDEVNNAVKLQFDQLEENLGRDLIEQFDAIERLNELNPQRIMIKLEQTKNEMNVHLNSIYSRLLREINTLQMALDVSKISMILTNEAGKLMKEMTDEEL